MRKRTKLSTKISSSGDSSDQERSNEQDNEAAYNSSEEGARKVIPRMGER
jgi:hypothetical protein